jgi:hypothetical protein
MVPRNPSGSSPSGLMSSLSTGSNCLSRRKERSSACSSGSEVYANGLYPYRLALLRRNRSPDQFDTYLAEAPTLLARARAAFRCERTVGTKPFARAFASGSCPDATSLLSMFRTSS